MRLTCNKKSIINCLRWVCCIPICEALCRCCSSLYHGCKSYCCKKSKKPKEPKESTESIESAELFEPYEPAESAHDTPSVDSIKPIEPADEVGVDPVNVAQNVTSNVTSNSQATLNLPENKRIKRQLSDIQEASDPLEDMESSDFPTPSLTILISPPIPSPTITSPLGSPIEASPLGISSQSSRSTSIEGAVYMSDQVPLPQPSHELNTVPLYFLQRRLEGVNLTRSLSATNLRDQPKTRPLSNQRDHSASLDEAYSVERRLSY